MISHKLKYVLLPKMREDRGQELKDCKKYLTYIHIFISKFLKKGICGDLYCYV